MPVRVFDDRELEIIREVFGSGTLSALDGKITPRFEKAFAEAMGAVLAWR